MITLAIDTSTPLGGICLYSTDRGILGEMRLGVVRTHSEGILSGIDFLLNGAGVAIRDVDFLTLTIGPGSFTGLRVGLSIVKGLAFSAGIRVVAVSTLRAFAYSLGRRNCLLCPLLDARKKEVYAAAFRREDDRLIEVVPEGAYVVEEFIKLLQGPALFAGNGAILYRERILKKSGNAMFAEEAHISIIPSCLAEYGMKEAERDNFADPAKLTPRYIRRSEAEIHYGKRQARIAPG